MTPADKTRGCSQVHVCRSYGFRMQYNVIIAGPHGSGKSCLIASAIIHARRLAVLDLQLVQRPHRPQQGGDFPRSSDKAVPELVVTANTGIEFWSAQERRSVDAAEEVDAVARRLWDRWLVGDPDQMTRSPASPFNVTSVASNLLGLEESVGTRQWINLIELSGDLFHSFDRSAAASRSAGSQRLRHMIRAADALVICLPCAETWNAATRLDVQNIASAWHEARGSEILLALTKSDLFLAEYSLIHRKATDPFHAVSPASAEMAVSADPVNLAFLKSLRSVARTELQICSSYGLLRLSMSPNVDLAKLRVQKVDGRAVAALPLWPAPSAPVSEIIPSAPSTLAHWMPLGTVESVFGATLRTATA
jgi:hypothetical protein